MAWNGNVALGFNSDGYGEWNNVSTYQVLSAETDTFEDTVEAIKGVAREYVDGLVEGGWVMPYDYCWGDVFDEVPDEVYASAGITIREIANAPYALPNDEIVIAENK